MGNYIHAFGSHVSNFHMTSQKGLKCHKCVTCDRDPVMSHDSAPPLWAKPSEAKTRKKKEHICTCRKPKLKKKNLGKRKNLETTQKKTQKTQKVIDKTLYKLV